MHVETVKSCIYLFISYSSGSQNYPPQERYCRERVFVLWEVRTEFLYEV